MLILISVNVSYSAQTPIVKVSCDDDGSIMLTGAEDESTVYAKYSGSNQVYFKVDGDWEESSSGTHTFLSDEAVLIAKQQSTFYVYFDKKTYTVTCPQFKFSCKALNVSIHSCYKRDNTFIAKFNVHSFRMDSKTYLRFTNPFRFNYEVKKADGKRLEHKPNVKNPAFDDVNISSKKQMYSNDYLFMWDTTDDISDFFILYDKCKKTKYNVFAHKECAELPICESDKNCAHDETCINQRCETIDCGECEYPQYHVCLKHECCEDEDCGGDKICKENKCETLNCSSGMAAVNHSCAVIICGDNEYLSEDRCVECDENEQLVENSCEILECKDDEHAVGHRCAKLECKDDEEAVSNECEKLECGFFSKPFEHRCINRINYWFGKIF